MNAILLATSTIAGFSPAARIVRTPPVAMRVVFSQTINVDAAVEQCILAAENEDAVQACLSIRDEAEENAALPTFAEDTVMDAVENCILVAASEDEVQQCMHLLDDEDAILPHNAPPASTRSPLSLCLQDAATDQDVDECVLESDEGSADYSFG